MHFIQKHILDELRASSDMRYAGMQPDGIESSHFRYHLKELEKAGYIDSPDRGVYQLTAKGQHFVDSLSRGTVNAINMPKVITYTLLVQGDTYLLQRKDKAPYLGLINMIGGKVHEGETTQEASCREVYEKAGIEIASPTCAGVFEIIIKTDDELITHAIAYVYTVAIPATVKHDLLTILQSEIESTEELAPDTFAIISSIKPGELMVNTMVIQVTI